MENDLPSYDDLLDEFKNNLPYRLQETIGPDIQHIVNSLLSIINKNNMRIENEIHNSK